MAMRKDREIVAYNPIAEEELHFSCKAQCAKYFGLKAMKTSVSAKEKANNPKAMGSCWPAGRAS